MKPLPELKALLGDLLAVEAAVWRTAILAHQALGENVRRMLNQPGERGVAAGEATLQTTLQRQEVDPKDPLPNLDAGLDHPVALMLMSCRGLLEGRSRPELSDAASSESLASEQLAHSPPLSRNTADSLPGPESSAAWPQCGEKCCANCS